MLCIAVPVLFQSLLRLRFELAPSFLIRRFRFIRSNRQRCLLPLNHGDSASHTRCNLTYGLLNDLVDVQAVGIIWQEVSRELRIGVVVIGTKHGRRHSGVVELLR
jgi:hypothetical protein